MTDSTSRIQVRVGSVLGLAALLKQHPLVAGIEAGEGAAIEFSQGDAARKVHLGNHDVEVRGLIETMDNNPIVCAGELSIPSPAGTLALIALAPLARAGLMLEPPTLNFSIEADADDVAAWLQTEAWKGGATVHSEPMDLKETAACTAIALIPTPSDLSDLDDLYDEAYGRALYVRKDEESPWDVALVAGRPYAVYRTRITADESTSLLTVQAMAHLRGKCGAAQAVHAMNVMLGVEESLGIGESLPQ